MKSSSLGGRVADDNLIERGVKRRRASCQFSLPSVALDAVNAAAKLLGARPRLNETRPVFRPRICLEDSRAVGGTCQKRAIVRGLTASS